jgi:hypothetical protein
MSGGRIGIGGMRWVSVGCMREGRVYRSLVSELVGCCVIDVGSILKYTVLVPEANRAGDWGI